MYRHRQKQIYQSVLRKIPDKRRSQSDIRSHLSSPFPQNTLFSWIITVKYCNDNVSFSLQLISYLTRHDFISAKDNSLLTWTMDIAFDLQHGLRLYVWTQPELTGWEEGGYSFILFLSFIQVNVLQPEFPFHPNPKARGRQTTWLYLGNTLEVLIMTFEQRGFRFGIPSLERFKHNV